MMIYSDNINSPEALTQTTGAIISSNTPNMFESRIIKNNTTTYTVIFRLIASPIIPSKNSNAFSKITSKKR